MYSETHSDTTQCPQCGEYGDKFIRGTSTDIEGFVVEAETTYHNPCGYTHTILYVDKKEVARKSS